MKHLAHLLVTARRSVQTEADYKLVQTVADRRLKKANSRKIRSKIEVRSCTCPLETHNSVNCLLDSNAHRLTSSEMAMEACSLANHVVIARSTLTTTVGTSEMKLRNLAFKFKLATLSNFRRAELKRGNK